MTFTRGPQSQPVRFQPQFPVATSPSLNQRIALYSLFLKVFFFRGRHPYSFQVVDQDRRHPLLKIAPSLPPRLFFLVYWLSYCSINHTSHAFAYRTGIVSLPNSVQIRKAKFKVVQNSDYGRLTSLRKTQMAISPGVFASIHYIGRPSSATLLIYSPFYCPFPCGLGQRAALPHVAPS